MLDSVEKAKGNKYKHMMNTEVICLAHFKTDGFFKCILKVFVACTSLFFNYAVLDIVHNYVLLFGLQDSFSGL